MLYLYIYLLLNVGNYRFVGKLQKIFKGTFYSIFLLDAYVFLFRVAIAAAFGGGAIYLR